MTPKPSIEPSTNYKPSEINHHHHAPAAHGDDEFAAVCAAYQDNISATIGPIVSEKLHELLTECGPRAIIHGITVAAQNNKRAFNYVAACARNHANGTTPPAKPPTNHPSSRVERSLAAVARVAAAIERSQS